MFCRVSVPKNWDQTSVEDRGHPLCKLGGTAVQPRAGLTLHSPNIRLPGLPWPNLRVTQNVRTLWRQQDSAGQRCQDRSNCPLGSRVFPSSPVVLCAHPAKKQRVRLHEVQPWGQSQALRHGSHWMTTFSIRNASRGMVRSEECRAHHRSCSYMSRSEMS